MSETLQTSKPESTSSGDTGRGCQRGGEYRRCRGGRFFRVVAVFLLIGVGVLIGTASHTSMALGGMAIPARQRSALISRCRSANCSTISARRPNSARRRMPRCIVERHGLLSTVGVALAPPANRR